MADERSGRTPAFFDDEAARNGGFGMLMWGFTTVAAVVLGFASWQYAPPRAPEVQLAGSPAADEITGSITVVDRGQPALPARVVGAERIAPMALGPGEPGVTIRDVEVLRGDVRELQRRMAQLGLTGDGTQRRIDRIEEKLTSMAAAVTPPTPVAAVQVPVLAAPVAPVTVEAAAAPPPAAAPAREAPPVRMVTAKPEIDPTAVTGSVPPKAATMPSPPPTAAPQPQPTAKTDRDTAAPVEAAKPAAPAAVVAAVDLGGYRSLASLKKSWSDMTDRYAEFGHGVEPLARLRETDSGMEARLVAGPYQTQQDAAKICLKMKALGVPCAVTGYTGQPLAAIR